MGEFLMPSLGADMDSGTVTRWLVQPGDTVRHGDIIAVIDTDKADVEVEVFQDGVVEELLVPEGTEVAVGAPLARIAEAGAPAPVPQATPAPARRKRRAKPPAGQPPAEVRTTPGPPRGDRERVSPRARRLAAAQGIDAGTLVGTGPTGAVTGRDIEQTITERGGAEPGAAARTERAAAMRAAIARAMARSKREIPHYYLAADVDVSRARAFLDARNQARPVTERILPAALLLKATALAVRDAPELNGYWIDNAFRRSEAIHVGVAISLRGGGLVAPAIHHTDTLSLDDLMLALRELVTRARAGTLRASEMSDPTITVTNLGEHGAQVVHGVIYPPQVALVGFGAITERPWATDGMIGVRPVVTATIAADHRASDGARGARLLELVDRHLQHPEEL
jgi:pyruvate dehydrogenase E2 component (dihydrolipoamide acetyltransferase)